jgi:transposase
MYTGLAQYSVHEHNIWYLNNTVHRTCTCTRVLLSTQCTNTIFVEKMYGNAVTQNVTIYRKRRILFLQKAGTLSCRGIAHHLCANEGLKVSKSAVHRLLSKVKQNGEKSAFSFTQPLKGRKGHVVTERHKEIIDSSMRKNPEYSSVDLEKIIADSGSAHISPANIRKIRLGLGWRYKKTKYCQLVRDANKVKRLQWATTQLQNNEDFHDVIFSDEASFEIQRSATNMYYKKGERPPLRPKPKHPVKVCRPTVQVYRGGGGRIYLYIYVASQEER